MKLIKKLKSAKLKAIISGLLFYLFNSGMACADGLSDLENALTRLQSKMPMSAVIELSYTQKREEDSPIESGNVAVSLDDNDNGLQITYNKALLEKMAFETQQKSLNDDAITPTLSSINRLSPRNLQTMLSAATGLRDRIKQLSFIDEKKQSYQGREVRVLSFDMPIETIIDDKKAREFVTKFKASYRIWIEDDGTPVETQMTFKGKGSAYVFFSLEAKSSAVSKYRVSNGRLLRTQSESKFAYSSPFGDSETTELETLSFSDEETAKIADISETDKAAF